MTRADLSWIYGALLAFIAILLAFVWISGSGGELLEPIRRADETERSPAPTEDPEGASRKCGRGAPCRMPTRRLCCGASPRVPRAP